MSCLIRTVRTFSLLIPVFLAPGVWAQSDTTTAGATSTELSPQRKDELRGDIAMAKKFYGDAVELYQKALQVEPRNPTLLNKIGIAYHQQMDWKQAKKYYERAIKVDKTYAYAINNLGMVEYHKKKWKNAAKGFQRALDVNPNLPAVQSNLGHAYFAMKEYDEAFSAFGRALALDPLVFERHNGNSGSILQDRSVEDRGLYFLFVAKTFASIGDVERCAQYLLKARDEGNKNVLTIDKDPAFAGVVKDPLIQEFLVQSRTLAAAPRR